MKGAVPIIFVIGIIAVLAVLMYTGQGLIGIADLVASLTAETAVVNGET
jgi:hypothetical protein